MRRVGLVSALIYVGLSLVAAGAFLAVTLPGDYSWVARVGGAAWIFALSMMAWMPIVIPAVRRRVTAGR
jgi:hypothetical protein